MFFKLILYLLLFYRIYISKTGLVASSYTCEALLNGLTHEFIQIALFLFGAHKVWHGCKEKKTEYEWRSNSNHYEYAEFAIDYEAALVEEYARNESCYRSIKDCETNLLKALVHSAHAVFMNTVNVLVAHMHHIINCESNEYYQTDRLCNSHSPPKEEDGSHQRRQHQAYRYYWEYAYI